MSDPVAYTPSERPLSVYIIVILQFVVGLNAIGGGMILMLAPDGSLMGMTTAQLGHGPFTSYLIPGMFLAAAVGLTSSLCAIGIWRRPALSSTLKTGAKPNDYWAWGLSNGTSLLTILWIHIQIAIIGPFWIQPIVVGIEVTNIACLCLPSTLKYCRLMTE